MIAPLLVAGSVPDANAAHHGEGEQEAVSFADVLSALRSAPPRGEQPVPETPADLSRVIAFNAQSVSDKAGDRGQIDDAAALPPANVAQDRPTTSGRAAEEASRVTAEVFNERGFFAVAVVSGSSTPPPVAVAVASTKYSGAETLDRSTAASSFADWRGVKRASGGRPATIAVHTSSTVPVQVISPAGGAYVPIAGPGVPREREVTSTRPLTPLPATRRERLPAATSPVAIALQEVDAGLKVIARVGGLDEVDRAALEEEVLALLSRHGFSSAQITVLTGGRRSSEGRM